MDRNIDGLRDHLWSTLESLSKGELGPAQANAMANTAGKLLKTVAVEIDYQRLTGQRHPITMLET